MHLRWLVAWDWSCSNSDQSWTLSPKFERIFGDRFSSFILVLRWKPIFLSLTIKIFSHEWPAKVNRSPKKVVPTCFSENHFFRQLVFLNFFFDERSVSTIFCSVSKSWPQFRDIRSVRSAAITSWRSKSDDTDCNFFSQPWWGQTPLVGSVL